jgi:hypothetical protein
MRQYIATTILSLLGIGYLSLLHEAPRNPSLRVLLDVANACPIVAVLLVVALFALAFWAGRPSVRRRAFERIYRSSVASCASAHEIVPAAMGSARRVPRRLIARWTRDFAARGYRPLGDIAAVIGPGPRPTRLTYRALADASGHTLAVLYAFRHALPLWLLQSLAGRRSLFRAVSLITRYADGVTIVTLFPPDLPGDPTPDHLVESVPWSAGVAALTCRHAQRLSEYAAAHPGVQPASFAEFPSALAFIADEWERARIARRERGVLTEADLPTLLDTNDPARLAEAAAWLRELKGTRPPPASSPTGP